MFTVPTVKMDSVPEISLIDFSLPKKLCQELLKLCSNQGGFLNSVEIKSPDSTSVVKIYPNDDDLIFQVVEPHYIYKKYHPAHETEENVNYEPPREAEANKFQITCLIPFNR